MNMFQITAMLYYENNQAGLNMSLQVKFVHQKTWRHVHFSYFNSQFNCQANVNLFHLMLSRSQTMDLCTLCMPSSYIVIHNRKLFNEI